jgi:RNA polymerase sigma factor (sigma-70 family)
MTGQDRFWQTSREACVGTASRDSEQARFERLYRETYAAMAGYALRRAGPADAADVVAETYLTLWRRMADAPDGAAALPWLYGVARRVLANQRRGEHRRSALVARLADELTGILPDAAELADPGSFPQIARAFAQLSEQDQELLALVGWEGLGRQQLAATLGTTRAAVRVRLHRARRRFARALGAEGIDWRQPLAAGPGPQRRVTARPGTKEASL